MPKRRRKLLLKEFTKDFNSCFDIAAGRHFNNEAAQELAIALRDNGILETIRLPVDHLTRNSKGVKELGKSLSKLSKLNLVKLSKRNSQRGTQRQSKEWEWQISFWDV